MNLFEKKSTDWETLEHWIEETINQIHSLRTHNKELAEKNKELKEGKKTFNEVKKKMEKKIKELIEKLSAIKE